MPCAADAPAQPAGAGLPTDDTAGSREISVARLSRPVAIRKLLRRKIGNSYASIDCTCSDIRCLRALTAGSGPSQVNHAGARATATNRLATMDLWNLIQWPAMAATLGSTWLVGSTIKARRMFGFYTFLVSNALWIVWGWHDGAWALVALQVGLAGLNIRGASKNDTAA
jgi:hypothetical protein